MGAAAAGKQYSGTLFVAFELGWTEWKLAFTVGLGQKPTVRSRWLLLTHFTECPSAMEEVTPEVVSAEIHGEDVPTFGEIAAPEAEPSVPPKTSFITWLEYGLVFRKSATIELR